MNLLILEHLPQMQGSIGTPSEDRGPGEWCFTLSFYFASASRPSASWCPPKASPSQQAGFPWPWTTLPKALSKPTGWCALAWHCPMAWLKPRNITGHLWDSPWMPNSECHEAEKIGETVFGGLLPLEHGTDNWEENTSPDFLDKSFKTGRASYFT